MNFLQPNKLNLTMPLLPGHYYRVKKYLNISFINWTNFYYWL